MDNEDDKTKKSMKAVKNVVPKVTPPRPGVGNVAKLVDPAAHATAKVQAVPIKDEFDFDTALHVALIGVGQGGGKISQSFHTLGYRRVCVFNTTDSDFAGLDTSIQKLSLDIGGAAKNMDLARTAAINNQQKIRDLLVRAWGAQFDCALICVGLGGGTGGGACLPLITQARKYMAENSLPPRVGAIVSLPSVDEGQQVARNAVQAFNELLQAGVSPLIIIDNDKVDELYHPAMSRLLPTSNELVSSLFHLFNQLAATKSPHTTFDRAELTELLDGGIVVMGSADLDVGSITSPADISAAVQGQLTNSILADVDIRTGLKAACIFVASPDVLDNFGREYFAAGFTTLNRMVGSLTSNEKAEVVHRGIYIGDEGLQCYTLIANLEPPSNKLQALAREAGVSATAAVSSVAKHLKVD